ncbi:hypothetical protein SLS62_002216 [Diatrype stigma]|uniref:Uncharacterized protein n=1 Tax=Diatrype stigma TaxID=117547 RepID=A0AAN9YVI4_9PEZI
MMGSSFGGFLQWGVIATPSPITHIRSLNEHQVLVAGLRDRMVIYDLRFLGSKNSYRHNNSSSSNNNHASHHNSTKWLHSPRNNNSTNNGNGNGNSNPNPNPNPNTNNTSYAANVALPLLTFPSYRNGAHINIGLDVSSDADVGAGPGIAAAAHDDGTVALYSLRSGNRLRAPLSPASPSPSSSSSTALPDGGDGMLGIDRIRSPRGPIQALQFQTFPRDRNPSLFVGVQSSVNVYSFGTGDGGDDEA